MEESGTCCSQSILTLENRKDPLASLVDLWGQGQILVSRTDNDTLPHLRVSIQNVPVWTFKTSPCVRAPRAHVSTHVRVVPAYPTTFGMYTRRFFLRPTTGFSTLFQRAATHTNTHTHTHTKHTPRPPTTPRPQRHTTQHNTQHHAETDRESETEKERHDMTRQDKTRQEKTIQDKKTREDGRGETRRDKRRGEKREERREKMKDKRRDKMKKKREERG